MRISWGWFGWIMTSPRRHYGFRCLGLGGIFQNGRRFQVCELPPGNLLHSYRKSPCLISKLRQTIYFYGPFSSSQTVSHNQRVIQPDWSSRSAVHEQLHEIQGYQDTKNVPHILHGKKDWNSGVNYGGKIHVLGVNTECLLGCASHL
jgi:hypothetical protein